MPLAAGTRLGPYEILGPLGAGGMGEVYRARDTRLNRDVALKVLPESLAHDPERMARFEREAHVLASLNHPHIATVYGFEAGAIGMELVEGPTLADRIGGRAMSLDEALPIAAQIAEGLEYAHEKGVVHRDLKPANVKLTADGNVKILDFGLAKALETPMAQGNPSISPTLTLEGTRAGVILGTAAYMAPEQARGAVVDKRADIWAFGVVLYEMLTGKQPFAGPTVSDTLAAVLKTEPDWELVPAEMRRIVRRCLAKDPRLRLRDIGEARIAVEQPATEDLTTSPTPPTKTHWWLRVSPWLAAASLLTTLGISWVYFRGTPMEQAAIRFSVSPPDKASFADPFAVSPDGRRLALVVNTPGSGQSLWVRRLDSVDAQLLPGTEGADQPFWSPDSRFIAFFAQGKLKKIEASGGPALALCDAPAGIRGSWSRNGTIIFNPTNRGPLHRVSEEGGAATQITTVDHSHLEDGHRFPQFLPDGRHFLYYAESIGDPTNERIYVASLDSKDRKALVPSHGMAAYAPAGDGRGGYLLFVREGTLIAQLFNPDRMQLSGEPFPVAERVADPAERALFSVSANGVLAHWAGGSTKAQLVWFDREGKRLGTFGAPGDDAPNLSPDGKRVAVTRGPLANTDIWLLDVARNNASRFTFDPAPEIIPIWSPDGARIVFSSKRSGRWNFYVKAASGEGNEELLLRSDEDIYAIDWSSDGRFIVYVINSSKTGWDLGVLPLDGDRKPFVFLQTQFVEGYGKFSPDGQWMAYMSDESGRFEIYVQPFSPKPGRPEGGASAGPGGKRQISTTGGQYPAWRRDGKELFYTTLDGKLMVVEVMAPTKGSTAFEPGVPKALFDTGMPLTPSFPYAPSSDGRRFLVNTKVEEAKSRSLTVISNWQAGLKR